MKIKHVYTAKEAAKKLRYGLSTIKKYCRRIGAAKFGSRWILTTDDLKKLNRVIKCRRERGE